MQMLLARPSAAQRIMSLMQFMPQSTSTGTTGYSTSDPNSNGAVGQLNMPNGDTEYAYRDYPKPYNTGIPANLVTRQGITLQRGPMRSLVDIARQSQWMPGIQEIGQIGGGYRTHDIQQSMQSNPYAADPGMSYHEQGLAIDAGEWSARQRLNRLLYEAGWNQFDRSYEPWHYSYGVTG